MEEGCVWKVLREDADGNHPIPFKVLCCKMKILDWFAVRIPSAGITHFLFPNFDLSRYLTPVG